MLTPKTPLSPLSGNVGNRPEKPRLLDLFCGAGGAAMGYSRAGFEVVGVDIKPQRYPFEFVQADALAALRYVIRGFTGYEAFDAIHASPPCQSYSRALKHLATPQPQLLEQTRGLLEDTGLPWVIENVVGAPLPRQNTLDGRYGIELCGTQFGLSIARHRLFEANFPIHEKYARHRCGEIEVMNPYNAKARTRLVGSAKGDLAEVIWREEMDVPWMNRYEGRQAIPPVFTEFIGAQLMAHLKATVAA